VHRRQDRGAKGAEVERRRRENRSTKGADGVGCGDFSNQNSELLCILGGIIYRFAARFARKNGAFGLPKLKLTAAACAHAEMERQRQRERKGKTEI